MYSMSFISETRKRELPWIPTLFYAHVDHQFWLSISQWYLAPSERIDCSGEKVFEFWSDKTWVIVRVVTKSPADDGCRVLQHE